MSNKCYEQHRQYTQNFLYRSLALFVSGIILYIPTVEEVLSHGLSGQIYFSLVTYLLASTALYDFSEERSYTLSIIVSTTMALLAPLTASVTLARVAITSAIMLTGSLLFIKTKFPENKLLNNTKTSTNKLRKSALDFNFPSVTKIILLFVTLNWLTSLGAY